MVYFVEVAPVTVFPVRFPKASGYANASVVIDADGAGGFLQLPKAVDFSRGNVKRDRPLDFFDELSLGKCLQRDKQKCQYIYYSIFHIVSIIDDSSI